MLIEAPHSHRATVAEAEQLARDLYGLDATASPLNGEFDDNFHLKTRENVEYALKIMRPGCDPALLSIYKSLYSIAFVICPSLASRKPFKPLPMAALSGCSNGSQAASSPTTNHTRRKCSRTLLDC